MKVICIKCPDEVKNWWHAPKLKLHEVYEVERQGGITAPFYRIKPETEIYTYSYPKELFEEFDAYKKRIFDNYLNEIINAPE